jgi:hypothetical protein
MASSSGMLIKTLGKIPFPIFGTAATGYAWSKNAVRTLPGFAYWTFPAVVGGMWFIWPAVDDEWKQSISIFGGGGGAEEEVSTAKVELDDEAKAKIAVAYKVDAPTEEEAKVLKQVARGDYTALEQDWNTFMEKSIKPGEDDDEDEEEDEEEEEEEEEEEDDE